MSNVKRETIIRTILLVVALVNQVLIVTGHSVLPVSDEQITEVISLVFTIGASLWAWWKNNSFTKNAIEADNYLASLREGDSNNG